MPGCMGRTESLLAKLCLPTSVLNDPGEIPRYPSDNAAENQRDKHVPRVRGHANATGIGEADPVRRRHPHCGTLNESTPLFTERDLELIHPGANALREITKACV